jgi:putative transcriptional regulator
MTSGSVDIRCKVSRDLGVPSSNWFSDNTALLENPAQPLYDLSVREFEPSSLSLAGSLLIAHPALLDPNFKKTVLFLSKHEAEEGSFGLILNRPAGRLVGDVLPNKPLGELARVPVLLGGPVQQDQLIFASFRWHAETERMECQHHLLIPEAQEVVAESDVIVRAFIGYAGWTKGQLEGELSQKAWMLTRPRPEVLQIENSQTLWREVTSSFGPWFRLVAESPDDPSAN